MEIETNKKKNIKIGIIIILFICLAIILFFVIKNTSNEEKKDYDIEASELEEEDYEDSIEEEDTE